MLELGIFGNRTIAILATFCAACLPFPLEALNQTDRPNPLTQPTPCTSLSSLTPKPHSMSKLYVELKLEIGFPWATCRFAILSYDKPLVHSREFCDSNCENQCVLFSCPYTLGALLRCFLCDAMWFDVNFYPSLGRDDYKEIEIDFPIYQINLKMYIKLLNYLMKIQRKMSRISRFYP